MPTPLFDVHCHLQNLPPDARAGIPEVVGWGCWATREADWEEVLRLEDSRCRVGLGLHPWYVQDAATGWEQRLREKLLEHPKVGLGEIGLDRTARGGYFARQKEAFCLQLDLARELDRAVSIHCVRAWGALLEILESRASLKVPIMLHAYAGSVELLPRLSATGLYFSFGGGVWQGKRAAAAVAAVPAERLLLESDAPDGVALAALPEVLAEVSRLRNEAPDACAARCLRNAQIFFRF